MRCHACDGHTDEHTDGQWKVVQYSVWAESAKITCLLAMSSYLDKLYRFILRAILAIWLLYWLEREGCHQFAFCAFGQHNGSNFHSYQEIALKWKPIFILTRFVRPCHIATHCHNVIAIGISQAREHNQPSPLIFFFKLSPESISLSKYQTALMII